MKIVSWNVAGFRAALKKGFIEFFNVVDADIFCIQEVKALHNQIEFDAKDYYEFLNPAERLGYSGTMIYTKEKPLSIVFGMDKYLKDDEGRLITLEFEEFYLINTYVPNVKRDISRLDYRTLWEESFIKYVKDLEQNKPVVICGDFNVAHTEIDIKNAKANIGNAGFTYEEREMFTTLLDSGLTDTYRFLNPTKTDSYTWWSYRLGVREKNIGWRIDYFLISKVLNPKLKQAMIYNEVYGSDHCPIGIEIDLK